LITQFYEKKYFLHKKYSESYRKGSSQVNKIFESNNFDSLIFIFLMFLLDRQHRMNAAFENYS